MNRKQYRLLILSLSISILFGCMGKRVSQEPGIENILWSASWSPDGKFIAVGGNHDTLRVFSGTDFRLVKEYAVKNTITKLKWHPNEGFLAIATQISPEKVSILDFSTDKLIPLDSISTAGARGIGWSHTGEYLAVGDNDGQVAIFSKKGEFIRKVGADPKIVTGLSWHPTKNTFVTVGSQISIYDFDRGILNKIEPRPVQVLMLCVEWHKTGDFFVTGDYGDYEKNYPALLQFWDSEGLKIKEIQESKAEYRNLKWTTDGEKLATASDALRIWSKNGELINQGKSETLLWGVDWSNDNQKIVTSSEGGEIVIWDYQANVVNRIKY